MKVVVGIITAIITIAVVYFINSGTASFIMKNVEKFNFITSDNVKIAANLFKVSRPKGWLILAHMMPATKDSWRSFAGELQEFGYESLAIDLRGHGESEGGPNGFQKFTTAEHQASINDVEAAWKFLQSRGAEPRKTTVIGASIGANLGLQFLTTHYDVGGGVLLSPGNYKGIDSGVLVEKLNASQNLLFVASVKDERAGGNNDEQNKGYYNSAEQVKNKYLIIFEQTGHGTDLFNLKNELDLVEAIKKFLTNGSIY